MRLGMLMLLAAGMVWAGSASGDEGGESQEGFLRQYAETFRFRLGHPASIEVSADGEAVFFLRSPSRSFVRDLYVFERSTGKERLLLTADDILGGAEEELTAEEKARRERMRLAARGIASFSLSGDGKHLLAPLSGRLFVVEWRTGKTRELVIGEGFPIDPRFSPDGRRVAYSKNGNLFVFDLQTNRETQLSHCSGDDIACGVPEFAAQEEMDRDHGYWWSPDGNHIAYQRNDDSELPTFYITDPADPAKEPQAWRYPRAGTRNTVVQFGVVPAAGGDTVWIDWDRKAYPYLTTVKWPDEGPLTMMVQNRHQTEEVLMTIDAATGKTRELRRETDDIWLNLDQDMPHWLPGGEQFLWTTERRGAWQLELRSADGSLVKELTSTDLIYREFVSYSASERAVYLLAADNPLNAQLHRLSLDSGKLENLTTEPGMYKAEIAAQGGTQVLTHSAADGSTRYLIREGSGKSLGELSSNAEQPSFELHSEYVEVAGDPTFHSVVLRPHDFQAGKKYPVILHVYGGPHSQRVTHQGSTYVLDQWIADQGYIVVWIDGRGTPYRGRDWERAIKYNFIDHPLNDQVHVLQELGKRYTELDLERVGVFGWSFGGYFSAMAVMRRPDIFTAGVAGAPVCDWQEYDTHYTERYLGLPDEQPKAYEVSNVTAYADQLERPLLIVHGTADDNVYFAHSLKMSNALFQAGKDHEMLTLSGQTHMVAAPTFVERMYARIMAHFDEHLAASGE